MTATTGACEQGRTWLSAYRDGEADDDPVARAHLDTCEPCTNWAASFDAITRQVRLRAPSAPRSVCDAVDAIADNAQLAPNLRGPRAILAFAALAGLVVVILGATGRFGHYHLGSPDGRQAETLMLSLTGGFALAAWRPERLVGGLMPVAVLAAAITAILSVFEVASGQVPLIEELAHLPILIGALGTIRAHRALDTATSRHAIARPHPVPHAV